VISSPTSVEWIWTFRRADIVAARKRAGTPISALDAQIAAICRQYEATLATRNLQDFTASGVELVDPRRS